MTNKRTLNWFDVVTGGIAFVAVGFATLFTKDGDKITLRKDLSLFNAIISSSAIVATAAGILYTTSTNSAEQTVPETPSPAE